MCDWTSLLAEHMPAMYRTAHRILGRTDEAEDCVQDVLVELIRRGEPERVDNWPALLRWLTTVRSLNRLKRRQRRREVAADEIVSIPMGEHGPPGRLDAEEKRAWLRSALAELPPRQGEVLVLRHFADMSYDEIGSVLGIERNAVGVALHAARQRLQEMLPSVWVEDVQRRCAHGDA